MEAVNDALKLISRFIVMVNEIVEDPSVDDTIRETLIDGFVLLNEAVDKLAECST